MLEQVMHAKIVEEDEPSYASPAMMIPKVNSEELRLVIDCRDLKEITVDDPFSTPDMNE